MAACLVLVALLIASPHGAMRMVGRVFRILLCAAALAPAASIAEPTLVVVVRHADRSSEPPADPALSASGERRAVALSQALEDAGMTAIVTTQFRRTRETAQPLAQRLGIQPEVVAVRRGEGAAHVPEVVAAVRRLTGRVLIVGHSDTVPGIVAGLGGPSLLKLCETSFSHLFVLTPGTSGATLMRLRYGEADPPPAEGCQ